MTRGSMRADVRCDPPADRPGHNEDAGNHTGRHYVDDADVLASSHAPQRRGEESMTASKTTRRRRRSTGIAAGAALLAGTALAAAREPPIVLAEMGSFHVGGRLVEIAGKPVKEVVFTPGGVPAKVDPNGTYMAASFPSSCCYCLSSASSPTCRSCRSGCRTSSTVSHDLRRPACRHRAGSASILEYRSR